MTEAQATIIFDLDGTLIDTAPDLTATVLQNYERARQWILETPDDATVFRMTDDNFRLIGGCDGDGPWLVDRRFTTIPARISPAPLM